MATDLIRYDLLVQDALRAVMRKVLSDATREGLPGDHHFFITFKTRAPGVRLSNRMREQYPKEMTIVLQHQFWDLTVGDQAFEVGLSFHGKSETLLIPFEAVTGLGPVGRLPLAERFAVREDLCAVFAGFDFDLLVAIWPSVRSTTASCAATDTTPPIRGGVGDQ